MKPASMAIELPYPPVTGNHAVRHARGRHYLTAEAQAYIQQVHERLRGRRAPDGCIVIDWLLAPPDRRARDEDNVMKVVKDALTKCGFWADDSNKVITAGSWQWTDPVPGGRIFLTATEGSTYGK